jgi:dipeptidyl aminopeptidase/acylaminoacyl peptidase
MRRRGARDVRLRGWAVAAAALVLPLPAAYVAVRSYRSERSSFLPRRRSMGQALLEAKLPGASNVDLRSRDGTKLRGWYVPSQNRGSVLLAHGAGSDRTSRIVDAHILVDAGFGALLFDFPGHGESEGNVQWDRGERDALEGAIDWTATQPDVDPERIGALGFSMGGYIVAQVASFDTRLRAVAIAGTPSDADEQTRHEYRRWGPISQLPALWASRQAGMRLDILQPRDVVPAIAPRPVLVIGGTGDDLVPPYMARELYDAAGEPKELYLVPGAGHGDYEKLAPGDYRERLSSFFRRSLLPH